MASLYARANARQRKILRAVEGAVRNVRDAHPDWIKDRRAARSIAKRAAGTITSQWRDVLATVETGSSSDMAGSVVVTASGHGRSDGFRLQRSAAQRMKPWTCVVIRQLRRELTRRLGPLKASGQTEAAEAFIFVLRFLSEREKGGSP
ncbi:MAG: hypothetical protein KGL39_03800 [Patescibacteria group bacterium]|nr:hypothetical protein [Patescibacteria group bacterium]